MSTGRAALVGLGQGSLIGTLFALLFGVFFTGPDFGGLLLYGVVTGGLFGHAVRRAGAPDGERRQARLRLGYEHRRRSLRGPGRRRRRRRGAAPAGRDARRTMSPQAPARVGMTPSRRIDWKGVDPPRRPVAVRQSEVRPWRRASDRRSRPENGDQRRRVRSGSEPRDRRSTRPLPAARTRWRWRAATGRWRRSPRPRLRTTCRSSACRPGTRNHFARDLGLDPADPIAALDALSDGVEGRIDVGEVNGRVFLNNVSLGIYAEAVRRRGVSRREGAHLGRDRARRPRSGRRDLRAGHRRRPRRQPHRSGDRARVEQPLRARAGRSRAAPVRR